MSKKINKNYMDVKWTGKTVQKELIEGLEILNTVEQPIISFFGSHIKNKWYKQAKELAKKVGENGCAVMSGGGPGIMEAANIGANESSAPSIGYKVTLLKREQNSEAKFTHEYSFKFMFVRRFLLAIKSNALVVFPGGFGTLNELTEYLDLMLIDITDTVPIILVGKDYWEGFLDWLMKNPVRNKTIRKSDLKYLKVVDTVDEAFKEIKKICN